MYGNKQIPLTFFCVSYVTYAFFRKDYKIQFWAIKCFEYILRLIFLSDSQGSFDLLQNTNISHF